jgi:hypothetical protein
MDAPHSPPPPQPDESMYLAVTREWCRALSYEERRKHPMGPYVLGRNFARSVAQAAVDRQHVAHICARLACRHIRDRAESWPLAHLPQEALDPAVAWWCAIEEPASLGVHYVELGGGTLEFLSVADQNDRPDVGNR